MPDPLPAKTTPVVRTGKSKDSSLYSQEVADEIIERMCIGHTLVGITRNRADGTPREPKEFPAYSTIYDWGNPTSTGHIPEFSARFAQAKLNQHRYWVEEAVEISNTPALGIEEIQEVSQKNGTTVRRARKDMLHHRMLQIDTRLKVAARLDPVHWAERLQQLPPAPKTDADESVASAQRIIIEGGLPDEEEPPTAPEPPQEPSPDEPGE